MLDFKKYAKKFKFYELKLQHVRLFVQLLSQASKNKEKIISDQKLGA
jgi:hypothetical protein